MKIKKKLRDLTEEEYEKNEKQICGSYYSCYECPFGVCNIMCGSAGTLSWIYHKDLFSDKFLDQEVEIEVPELLTKEDKEYLETVIKSSKDNINYIVKYNSVFNKWEGVHIACGSNAPDLQVCFKKGTMLKNMELNKEYTLEELGLFKEQKPKRTPTPTKKKITLTDFWSSKEKLAIHCNTETKANKLLKAFDKLGNRWASGESYLEINFWNDYKKDTCYTNSCYYCDYDFYKGENYTIYEFEDVDLDN